MRRENGQGVTQVDNQKKLILCCSPKMSSVKDPLEAAGFCDTEGIEGTPPPRGCDILMLKKRSERYLLDSRYSSSLPCRDMETKTWRLEKNVSWNYVKKVRVSI